MPALRRDPRPKNVSRGTFVTNEEDNMMLSRITLAILAATTILTFTAPADARPTRAKNAQVATQVFDVAAQPAYPTTSSTAVAREKLASRGRGRVLTDANGNPVEITHQGASSGESGVVRSKKTGATARVSPRYAGAFQAYIDDLESRGAAIYYMGGYRKGPCWAGGLHPCGKALDVCQDSRDHVSGHKNCHMPGRAELARIAAAHGLFEGGQWCHGDMGHVQVGETAAPCRRTLYSAVDTYKRRRLASRGGHRS